MKAFFSTKTLLAALSLALVPLATSASAQTILRLNAPFAFTVGSQVLPAGQYALSTDPGRMRLMVNSLTSTTTAMVQLGQGGASRPAASAKDGVFRFEKWGNQYFLVGIFKPGSITGESIVPSPKLVELARAEAGPEVAPTDVEIR